MARPMGNDSLLEPPSERPFKVCLLMDASASNTLWTNEREILRSEVRGITNLLAALSHLS